MGNSSRPPVMVHRFLHIGRRVRSLWNRYWRLPASQRIALWQAASWIVLVRTALEMFSFQRVLQRIERKARRHLDARRGQQTHSTDRHRYERPQGEFHHGELNHDEFDRAREHLGKEDGIPYEGCRDAFDPRSPTGRPHYWQPVGRIRNPAALRTLWAVRATGRRLMPKRPCLTQALVGRLLLARCGVDVAIHIGVTKAGDELKAHAWLEHGGDIILGGSQSRDEYRPFPVLNR